MLTTALVPIGGAPAPCPPEPPVIPVSAVAAAPPKEHQASTTEQPARRLSDCQVESHLVNVNAWQQATILFELAGGQGTINVPAGHPTAPPSPSSTTASTAPTTQHASKGVIDVQLNVEPSNDHPHQDGLVAPPWPNGSDHVSRPRERAPLRLRRQRDSAADATSDLVAIDEAITEDRVVRNAVSANSWVWVTTRRRSVRGR